MRHNRHSMMSSGEFFLLALFVAVVFMLAIGVLVGVGLFIVWAVQAVAHFSGVSA